MKYKDILSILLQREYFSDKKSAEIAIMEHKVFVNEMVVYKGSDKYKEETIKAIRIKDCSREFVSRGGYKLKKAINYFDLKISDKICLDVGSSTGGFCDCLLKHGAKKVYALDVGTNQLAFELRSNKNITTFEKTNFKTIKKNFFDIQFDIITMDVSFISVKSLLKNVEIFLKKEGIFICLLKPQFEATSDEVTKYGGVITDLSIHQRVFDSLVDEAKKFNFRLKNSVSSPIKGSKGNQEYLLYFDKQKAKDDYGKNNSCN